MGSVVSQCPQRVFGSEFFTLLRVSLWACRSCDRFQWPIFVNRDIREFLVSAKAEAQEGRLSSWICLCFPGAAVSAGCGEQMQGCIPERQLCHRERAGILGFGILYPGQL